MTEETQPVPCSQLLTSLNTVFGDTMPLIRTIPVGLIPSLAISLNNEIMQPTQDTTSLFEALHKDVYVG